MNKMQRCVLGLYSYDEHAEDLSLENILNQSINLIASMPTMMVNAYQMKRRYYDKQSMFFHLPKPGQSTAEHILSTYRPDQKFTHEEAKLLDMCLLVHADHGGGNCSTFTTRVLSSSGTDTYSAIAAAIGALKGPKHGGANLMVNRQLKDILKHVENPEDDDEVREYLRRILRKQAGDGSGLIYGMGHAVYTISDPREVVLKQRARHLAYEKGFEEEYNMLCSIERLAPGIFAEEKGSTKPVCANVDLFSGLIYNMLGISRISTPRCLPLPVCPAGVHTAWKRWYSPTASFAPLTSIWACARNISRSRNADESFCFAFVFILSVLLGVLRAADLALGTDAVTGLCVVGSVWWRLCGIGHGGAGCSAHGPYTAFPLGKTVRSRQASGRCAGLCRCSMFSGGSGCADGAGAASGLGGFVRSILECMCSVWLSTLGRCWLSPSGWKKALWRAVSGGGGQCAVLLERADALYGEQLQLAPGGPDSSGVAGAGSTGVSGSAGPGTASPAAGQWQNTVRSRACRICTLPVLAAAPCTGFTGGLSWAAPACWPELFAGLAFAAWAALAERALQPA